MPKILPAIVAVSLVALLVVALGAVAGCDGLEPAGGSSCVRTSEIWSRQQPQRIDLVLVIDRSAEMAPYLGELDEQLRGLGQAIERGTLGFNLHATSIAADLGAPGILARECTGTDARTIHDSRAPWWTCSGVPSAKGCPVGTTTSSLSDVLPCLGRFGAAGSDPRRPVDALLRIFDPREPEVPGFLRDQSIPVLIIVAAGDDQSPGAVAELFDLLVSREPSFGLFAAEIIGPEGAPRLTALAAYHGARFDSIDSNHWGLGGFTADRAVPERGRCFEGLELIDLDVHNPGLQPPISIERLDDPDRAAPGELVEPCQMLAPDRPHPDTPLPCYWFQPADDPSWPNCPRLFWLEAPPGRPALARFQYETRCGLEP